jgi:hypothetical protein
MGMVKLKEQSIRIVWRKRSNRGAGTHKLKPGKSIET